MNFSDQTREKIIGFCQKLIQTPSVNGQNPEKYAAKLIHEFAQGNGLESEISFLDPDRPCVLVRTGSTDKSGLTLIGHIDTVPVGDESSWEHPPFGGVIKNGRIHGRGAIDTKGGITAALAALLHLNELPGGTLEKSVLLACVPDEESGATGTLGIKHLYAEGQLRGEGAIYTYPDIDKINIGHRGLYRLKVTTHGKSFHSGSLEWQMADKNLNALTGMAEIILALERLEIAVPDPDPFFDHFETRITPTLLSGGSGPSIIPNFQELVLDIRLVPSVSKEMVDNTINEILAEISQNRKPLDLEISPLNYLPPTIIPQNASVVSALRRAAKEITGIDPDLTVSGPANESYLLNQYGIPTCTYGPVGGGAHAVDEYVEIESIFQVADVYAATALSIKEFQSMGLNKNVLVIFNDDHAQWASGTYGNTELDTPNIDQLAASGIQMDNAFTPTPVCSPSRACFLTGRLASQHGIHDYLGTTDPEVDKVNWLEDEVLLPHLLAEKGYQTAYSGKWHLGQDDRPHPDFDYWFSLSGDYPWKHYDRTRYCDNGEEVYLTGFTTDIITEKALTFLGSRDDKRPFFLMVGYTATHSPWEGQPEELVSRYQTSSFEDIPREEYLFGRQVLESTEVDREDQTQAWANYYAAVTHLDQNLGKILDELETAGLREDTLVVYTSDHGLNCGHHGIWGKGNGTFPLNMVDESIRIPMIINQPDTVEKGHVLVSFVDHTDLFQTILDYAGIDPDEVEGRNYPGTSFLKLLENPDKAIPWREIQFGEYGPLRMGRTNQHKLILRGSDGPHALFDLIADPRETINLFELPDYEELIQFLSWKIESYFGTFEEEGKSGLLGDKLPRHNRSEAWRFGKDPHSLLEISSSDPDV